MTETRHPLAKEGVVNRRTQRYAAKFRAETVRYEPPILLEPTDGNLAAICSSPWLARPARAEDYDAIRRELAAIQRSEQVGAQGVLFGGAA